MASRLPLWKAAWNSRQVTSCLRRCFSLSLEPTIKKDLASLKKQSLRRRMDLPAADLVTTVAKTEVLRLIKDPASVRIIENFTCSKFLVATEAGAQAIYGITSHDETGKPQELINYEPAAVAHTLTRGPCQRFLACRPWALGRRPQAPPKSLRRQL